MKLYHARGRRELTVQPSHSYDCQTSPTSPISLQVYENKKDGSRGGGVRRMEILGTSKKLGTGREKKGEAEEGDEKEERIFTLSFSLHPLAKLGVLEAGAEDLSLSYVTAGPDTDMQVSMLKKNGELQRDMLALCLSRSHVLLKCTQKKMESDSISHMSIIAIARIHCAHISACYLHFLSFLTQRGVDRLKREYAQNAIPAHFLNQDAEGRESKKKRKIQQEVGSDGDSDLSPDWFDQNTGYLSNRGNSGEGSAFACIQASGPVGAGRGFVLNAVLQLHSQPCFADNSTDGTCTRLSLVPRGGL